MSITLSSRERPLLIKIQQYFNGMGAVYPLDPSKYLTPPTTVDYKVFNFSQLVSVRRQAKQASDPRELGLLIILTRIN